MSPALAVDEEIPSTYGGPVVRSPPDGAVSRFSVAVCLGFALPTPRGGIRLPAGAADFKRADDVQFSPYGSWIEKRDYYEVLGVSKGVSCEDVRKA